MNIYFLWINISSLNGYISLKVNNYIISLKLNKYYSLKLHKYTVAGCKIIPTNIFCRVWIYIFLEFCNEQQTTNHSQLWSGDANKYKLWFISSLRTLRAETSCIPMKSVCVATTNPPLQYHWNLLFTENFRSRLYSMRMSRKNRFRKLKITLVGPTYLGQRPQCPSL